MYKMIDRVGAPTRLVAVAVFLCSCSAAKEIAAIRLPGEISRDAQVGLAIVGKKTIYAAYWEGSKARESKQLAVYAVDVATRRPLDHLVLTEDRMGDLASRRVRVFISENDSVLLCVARGITAEKQEYAQLWTLSARPLKVLSRRNLSGLAQENLQFWGITREGEVRVSTTPDWKEFARVTIIDLDSHDLDTEKEHRTIQFRSPAWMYLSVGLGDALWILEGDRPASGKQAVEAYDMRTGHALGSHEIPGDDPVSGLTAVDGGVLVDISQPPSAAKVWSRLLRVALDSAKVQSSETVLGCDVAGVLEGSHEQVAVAGCEYVERTVFDQYRTAKSQAIVISTATASIVSIQPLNTGALALTLALDDSNQNVMLAIYDRQGTVRVLALSERLR
jgi:hypothetical protein